MKNSSHTAACENYLLARTGRYEWRKQRYSAVARIMVAHGLNDDDMVIDVGAGWTEFDFYLRTEMGWRGRYLPIDGGLDGVDIETWTPPRSAAFIVAIELLEHLENPWRLMQAMAMHATKAAIATTPNPDTVDVRAMDETHITPLTLADFTLSGWSGTTGTFYGQEDDALLAWFSKA